MAKRYCVRLTDDERTQLKALLAKKRLAAQKRKRAQILLKADACENGAGWVDTRIAEAFDVTVATVENVRKRCVLDGLDAAIERKKQCRLSRQRVLDGEKEASASLTPQAGTVPLVLTDDSRSGPIVDFDIRGAWHNNSDTLSVWIGWEEQVWEDIAADLARNLPGNGVISRERDSVTFSWAKVGISFVF